MSILVNFAGIIEFKNTPEILPEETLNTSNFRHTLKDNIYRITSGESGCRVVDSIEQYLTNHLDDIEGAYITITNDTEDDVPFVEVLEVWEGNMYKQVIDKHISMDWLYHVAESRPAEYTAEDDDMLAYGSQCESL